LKFLDALIHRGMAPTAVQRILVALAIASVAAAMHYSGNASDGGLSDFSILWYGSKVLAEGGNPYDLIGPHRSIDLPSSVFYPAPALVALMPFALIPSRLAGTVFIFLSAALLVYGATRDGWHRLPIFPSVAFMTSARQGQLSAFICAALFIPALSFFSVAKPQASLPILAAARSVRPWLLAIAGGILFTLISFLLLPNWPAAWWKSLAAADYFRPPIMTIPGAFIALVLLRWRRPEAWLVFVAACLPQTWYPYNGLILLTIGATYRESAVLSLVSSSGWLITYGWLIEEWRSPETRAVMQLMLILLGYLPAVILVLRRKNEAPTPIWLRYGRQPSATSTTKFS
jgi:hypothetical protein